MGRFKRQMESTINRTCCGIWDLGRDRTLIGFRVSNDSVTQIEKAPERTCLARKIMSSVWQKG